MSLDQLYATRPTPKHSGSRTPVTGLYLCGSGAHPGIITSFQPHYTNYNCSLYFLDFMYPYIPALFYP